MIKSIFTILLAVHVLCDFYLQTEKMAERKNQEFKWLILHLILYAIISATVIATIMPGFPWFCIVLLTVSHGVIDIIKYIICSCINKRNKENIYVNPYIFMLDQIMHITILLIITYWMKDYPLQSLFNIDIQSLFTTFKVSETYVLGWVVKIMLIHKPANILIANILHKYKPKAKQSKEKDTKNVGRFIGTLERVIMTIFISINQFSAVGLVLTAKSIARYDKISKEQEFAEYYLLGTLLSTICAIGVAVLF